MTISKTIFTFLISAIIGAFTVLLAGSKKGLKDKLSFLKVGEKKKEGDNLFV